MYDLGVFFVSFTGWEYNEIHAALWKCDLMKTLGLQLMDKYELFCNIKRWISHFIINEITQLYTETCIMQIDFFFIIKLSPKKPF